MSRTMNAAMWAFLATAGTRVVTLISLAVLARLLAPRDFGLLAFALIYITYAETIGDLGTTIALIYWPERRDDAAQVTFVTNVIMGLFWFALTLLLAPAIAAFFRNPQAADIVRVLSVCFVIKFLGNTHDALAQKDLRFRARAIPELALAVVKAAVSIVLAALGFGTWSMVWGYVAGQTVWTLASWLIVPWRPRLAMPRDLFGPMLRYGRGIVGVNVIAAIVHHADKAVVGRLLGSVALGVYQIADKIPDATVTVIIWVVSKVLFPAFARLQHSIEELRAAYLRALTYVSIVTVPVAAGLCVAAEPLVRVVFGPKWMAAVPLLRWLAIYTGIRSLGTHAGDVLKATGRSGLLAAFGVVKAALLIPALIVAARWGVDAVAMALALVTLVTVAINIVIVMRILRFGVVDVLRSMRSSALAGAALIVATLPLLRVEMRPELLLAATVAAGAAAYLAALFMVDRPLFAEIREAVRR